MLSRCYFLLLHTHAIQYKHRPTWTWIPMERSSASIYSTLLAVSYIWYMCYHHRLRIYDAVPLFLLDLRVLRLTHTYKSIYDLAWHGLIVRGWKFKFIIHRSFDSVVADLSGWFFWIIEFTVHIIYTLLTLHALRLQSMKYAHLYAYRKRDNTFNDIMCHIVNRVPIYMLINTDARWYTWSIKKERFQFVVLENFLCTEFKMKKLMLEYFIHVHGLVLRITCVLCIKWDRWLNGAYTSLSGMQYHPDIIKSFITLSFFIYFCNKVTFKESF